MPFRHQGINIFGRAGENRTLVNRLKAGYSAIELQPHKLPYRNTLINIMNYRSILELILTQSSLASVFLYGTA